MIFGRSHPDTSVY